MIGRVLAALVLLAACPAFAQTTAAQITGRVADPSGAIVQGAVVAAVNAATGASRETQSNELGNYTVPLLEPGTYKLVVTKEGFRPIERTGLTLHVNQVVRIDLALTVGSVSETISVTGDAPLLQTSGASLGAIVDNRKIIDLPLNGRNPFDLVFLTPGTLAYGRLNLPGNNIPLSNLSINGGPAMGNEVLLDGIPNTAPQFNQYAIIPSIDAVQEFKVQTNNMSAEFGRTSGGVVNVSMRSGSNQLHGSLYEFLRNSALDSNRWFNNATGQAKPPFRYNQFGAAVGGPVRKDKTFFFGNYELLRRRTGRTFLFSVPTMDQRRGDFSKTRANSGQVIQVFDPVSTRAVAGGGYVRDPFPGNAIPAGRFNNVAKNILSYWAEPNLAGHPVTGIQNFISNASEAYDVDQVNARIDHAFTDTNRIFARVSWNSSLTTPPNIFGNVANPASGPQIFTQRNVAVNDTHGFSPNTFATFRAGFARLRDHGEPISLGFDATKLGLPAYFAKGQEAQSFPAIQVNGYTVTSVGFGTSSIGPVTGALLNNISNAYTAQSDVTHMRGKHIVKSGFEYRLFRLHGFRPNLGNFNFTAGFTQGPDPTRGSPTVGHAFASYLLGTASGGGVYARPTQDTQTQYYAAFFQDDYRITTRLTLNLGVRFEREDLRTDRWNRLNYLDFTTPSPLQVEGLGQLRGGLQFVGVNGNPREQARWYNFFSPRFGFAYQLDALTVLRGGYGIFVAPRTGWDFGNFGQTGYSANTALVASDDGVTPRNFIDNPYPNGFVLPSGNSLGMLTNIGGGLDSIDRDQKATYIQQWNFDVQRSLPYDMVVDVAYAGSKGTHLLQNLQYNQLPDRYLALGNELIRRVPNPFFGKIPATQALGTSVTTVGQLLRPYPHFTGFSTTGSTSGSSIYHSMQSRFEKRFSHGFSFLAAYTIAKLIDDGANGIQNFFGPVPSFQNHNNRKLERSISSQEVPQRLSLAYNYELPIGKGKALAGSLSGLVEKLAGGWQINGVSSFQSGRPLALATSVNNTNSFGGGSRPNNNGKSAKLEGATLDRLDHYFDTRVFSLPEPFTFGNTSRTLPDVRSPGVVNFDFSLIKNTRLFERFVLQFRAEAFNALNNTNFGAPNQSIGAPGAGVIGSSEEARILQFGLKLNF